MLGPNWLLRFFLIASNFFSEASNFFLGASWRPWFHFYSLWCYFTHNWRPPARHVEPCFHVWQNNPITDLPMMEVFLSNRYLHANVNGIEGRFSRRDSTLTLSYIWSIPSYDTAETNQNNWVVFTKTAVSLSDNGCHTFCATKCHPQIWVNQQLWRAYLFHTHAISISQFLSAAEQNDMQAYGGSQQTPLNPLTVFEINSKNLPARRAGGFWNLPALIKIYCPSSKRITQH